MYSLNDASALALLILLLVPGWLLAKEGVSGSVELEMGYGHDSNVSVDDVELSTSLGDSYRDLGVGADIHFEPVEGLDLGASFNLADKRYTTFDEFDGRLSLVSLSADKDLQGYSLGSSLRYIDYRLDGDAFLELLQFAPTISWFPSTRVYIRLGYERSHERFPEAVGRNNDQDQFDGSVYYFVNGLRHYWMVRLSVLRDSADDPVFSNDSREARLVYHREFTLFDRDTQIEVSYRFQNRRYDEGLEPSIRQYREDSRARFEIRGKYPVSKQLELELRALNADNRSNLNSADYEQSLVQLTLRYAMPF